MGTASSKTRRQKSRKASIDSDDDFDMEEVESLSNRQKEIIKRTWEKIEQDAEMIGVKTFSNLFETHPKVKDEFTPFASIDTKDKRYTEILREHGLRVISTVGKMVKRLDEEDTIELMLRELGSRHGARYNAKPSLIGVIGKHFCKSIQISLADEWNSELEDAYTHMFAILTYNMKTAMTKASIDYKFIY